MHKYDVFVPMSASPVSDSGAGPGTGDQQPKQPTEKGALYYEYYQPLHIVITHLRRVRWENPIGDVKGVAKRAADPLAQKGTDLYYYHSRTAYYNSFFFEFWDECFAPTFSFVNFCVSILPVQVSSECGEDAGCKIREVCCSIQK